jgi:serine protease AprX
MTPIASSPWRVPGSAALLLALLALTARAGEITPALERSMSHKGTHADTSVILRFTDPVDTATLAHGDRRGNQRLLQALKERTALHRATIEPVLRAQGAVKVRDLWLINAVAFTVPAVSVGTLAALDGVATLDLDAFVQGGRSQRTPAPRDGPGEAQAAAAPTVATADLPVPDFKRAKPGWNLTTIHAPELWAMGHTGKGVVVATMDTGVDAEHPELRGKWRGGANSWFDPHGEQPLPYDALGHGTQSLGVVLGGPDIGLAPQARWIGVRLYDNNGRASMSDIHLGFQWLMDPDGDPATADAPNVVNASWALTGRAVGSCILEFSDDIRALKSAGIAVVFAAGNDGPVPNTSNSPGNNPGVMSVGAIDEDMEVARQTSRGPSSCDRGVFPRIMAPGVKVRTADLSHGGQASYTTVSGSSLAAPHVSGVIALLAGAFPNATVAELEAAVLSGAQALGGTSQNRDHRRVDALAAFNALRDAHNTAPGGSSAVALTPTPGMEKTP